MVTDDLIVHIFCVIDDAIKQLNLPSPRRRGPAPILADSEVIAILVAGELLGYQEDKALFRYFRDHTAHLFPGLRRVHRSTFVRQAANLWKLQQRIHEHLVHRLSPAEDLWLIDSMPLPVCRFARAKACRLLADVAAYGHDPLSRSTDYGLRLHLRTTMQGLIGRFELTPANTPDIHAAPEMVPEEPAMGIGDRAYWSPEQTPEIAARGWDLKAPFHKRAHDPNPQHTELLMRARRIIETVNGQLVERFRVKQRRARDLWHLTHRITRKILSHTAAFLLNRIAGHPPLQFAQLLD